MQGGYPEWRDNDGFEANARAAGKCPGSDREGHRFMSFPLNSDCAHWDAVYQRHGNPSGLPAGAADLRTFDTPLGNLALSVRSCVTT